MKPPLAFKFAAVWALWMLLLGGSIFRPTGGLGGVWGTLVLVLCIWQGVGLFAMRRVNIWIAAGVLILSTVSILLFLTLHLTGKRGLPVQGVLILPVFAVFNAVSVWYFLHPGFRDFAARFVAERESEKHSQLMAKASQKCLTAELRRMKTGDA